MDEPKIEKQWKVREVATVLGMHVETLRREIRAKKVRTHRVSKRGTRIPDSEVQRLIAAAAAAGSAVTP